MNKEKNALEAMLEQYQNNNKPKYEKSQEKVYDLKNYFTTFLKDGVKSATKQIRILPTQDGSSPFVEMKGHKTVIDGEKKTVPCLKSEKNTACPFCEAREALLATGNATDKEIAKKYGSRLMYVVKVIDRDNEQDGVKFWRFNHDYRNEGIYDKIFGVLNAIKKDVTHPETGRDLVLTINRNQNNIPVVSAVASLDPTPLSTDAEQMNLWMSDTRTWEDVYSVRNYEYMEILVKGGTPVWSSEEKKFVDKALLNKNDVQADSTDSEITMGLETLKTNLQEASPAVKTNVVPVVEEDDLPF